jgi:glycerophosphoryl diester phosphodiesterase
LVQKTKLCTKIRSNASKTAEKPMKTRWNDPLWIAHRGAGKLAPENTLAAFRLGAHHGFRAFECDVQLSADGVPFLLHDDTLDRTTSGHGVAGDWLWSALQALDAGRWHSAAYAGEPLPTLEAAAQFCQQNACSLNIEIKPSPGTDARTGQVVAETAARLWTNEAVAPLLSSFSLPALRRAQAAAPHLPRALLLDALPANWLNQAQTLGCVAVVLEHTLIDEHLVQQLHTHNLRALCYTVNDVARAQQLIAWGMDGLITDVMALPLSSKNLTTSLPTGSKPS